MKLTVNEEQTGAWLDDGTKQLGLIGKEISCTRSEYVCYYKDINDGTMPFALTDKGVQVPVPVEGNKKNAYFITYEELVTLVKAGREISKIFEDNKFKS